VGRFLRETSLSVALSLLDGGDRSQDGELEAAHCGACISHRRVRHDKTGNSVMNTIHKVVIRPEVSDI